MKNPYNYIHQNPERSKRLFGITYDDLCQLIDRAVSHQAEQLAKGEVSKVRINAPGGGCPPKLTAAEQVSLCLFYLRHHETFEVLGLHDGVCESTAHETYHQWVVVLRQLLPASWLEEVSGDAEKLDRLQQILTEHELLVDSTEQSRERPKDNDVQKAYYSGKKKQHTFKSQIISLETGHDIVDVLVGEPGPRSDQSLLREQQTHFSEDQHYGGDKGYQGVARTRTPVKKPRNQELSAEQKQSNKEFSQNRIYIEHLIRVIKIWRIAKAQFRLDSRHYETAILVVCGLVRLRLGGYQLGCFQQS
ncbi:MAG: transposase family protein [Cyanobacteria bacterium P01_B01_bin.77]